MLDDLFVVVVVVSFFFFFFAIIKDVALFKIYFKSSVFPKQNAVVLRFVA